MRFIPFLLVLAASLTLAAQDKPARERDDGSESLGHHVPADKDTILRVQIFLDEELFTPGKIDGVLGEFSYKAVVNWNYAHGHKEIYDWQPVIRAAEAKVPVALANYTVREEMEAYINRELPEDPKLWQNYKAMLYRSMDELVAERFHTDETFLQKANPGLDTTKLKPGDVVQVPSVHPFKIELVKQYQGFKEDAVLSHHIVVIDTTERMGAIYDHHARYSIRQQVPRRRSARGRFHGHAHPPWPQQPRGHPLGRPEQVRHRPARHRLTKDHRPRPERRLRALRELGRHPPARPRQAGIAGDC